MPGTTETLRSERADAAGADGAADADGAARSPAGAPLALSDGVRTRSDGVTAGLAVIGLVADGFDRAAIGFARAEEVGFARAEEVADVGDPDAEPADCGSATGPVAVGLMLVVSGEPWLAGVKNGEPEADGPRSGLPGPAGAGDSVNAVRRDSTSAPPGTPPAAAAYGLTAAG
jgi:hypothetical protein